MLLTFGILESTVTNIHENFNSIHVTSLGFPNPVENEVHLNSSSNWHLFDTTGNILKEGQSRTIEFNELSSGFYIIQTENGAIKVYKM